MATGARAMGRRKLLVVLGAGSSIPCNMPSVGDINEKMKQWSCEWENLPEFPTGSSRGVFNDLWEIVEGYYRQNLQPQLGLGVNFERILGEMTALASWVTPSPFGNTLREAVQNCAPADAFTWPHGRTEPYFYRQLILDQLGFLLGRLADFMRERSRSLDENSQAFIDYREIVSRLRDKFEVGIYNLNYDTVAQSAWSDAYNGFKDGSFDARGIGQRQEWDFIYPLHGSVHYSFSDPPFTRTLRWEPDLNSSFENCQPVFPEMASEFRPIVPTTLVAGGFKLDQLLADPAQSFHAALVRHMHEADAVLIAGYGFGDAHVNRALRNRFALSPFKPAGRPPAVVLTNTAPAHGSVAGRQGHEFWAWELTHTLNCRFQASAMQAGNSLTAAPYVENGTLETDMNGRVAVWHSGFAEALGSIDRVISWLRR